MHPVSVERSHTIARPRAEVFDATIPMDLTVLFDRWFGPIPPIREVRDQTGAWDRAGRRRTVALRGGGSMREELTAVEAPMSFSYRLSGISGAMAPLVDHIDGRWRFEEAGSDRTTVTWAWTLYPRSTIAQPAVALFGTVWRGYARRSLERLETLVVTTR